MKKSAWRRRAPDERRTGGWWGEVESSAERSRRQLAAPYGCGGDGPWMDGRGGGGGGGGNLSAVSGAAVAGDEL